jgi:isopentenyl-diphosphate delta-isomerase
MEINDIVNDKDEVIGKATCDEIYEKFLNHRIVHILIFNDKGEMALHLRSKYKPFCPNYWCTPAGGRVQSGESYEKAALRELGEELGIRIKIHFAYKDIYIDHKDETALKMFLATFRADYNGPFKINPAEVKKIGFFSLDKIKEMINKGEKFHPELLFLLKKYFKIK